MEKQSTGFNEQLSVIDSNLPFSRVRSNAFDAMKAICKDIAELVSERIENILSSQGLILYVVSPREQQSLQAKEILQKEYQKHLNKKFSRNHKADIIKYKTKRMNDLIVIFGSSLEVRISHQRYDIVISYLDNLLLLPDQIIRFLKRKGLRLVIGDSDVVDLADRAEWTQKRPRGYKNQDNFDGVSGVCQSSIAGFRRESIAYVGDGMGIEPKTMLHEFGHGIGNLLGINDSKELIMAHKRLYPKLREYFQQEGPGGEAGRREFFAESFADFHVLSQKDFICTYDETWYVELRKMIELMFQVDV